MAAVERILRSYRAPRVVAREHRDMGADDGLALTWLLTAAMLFFVAQMPGLSRDVHLAGTPETLYPQMLGRFFGVMVAAFICYGVAALSHVVAKAFGAKGRWLDARLALFWALLAATPLMLLQGLVSGFIGAGPQLTVVSIAAGLGFGWIWLAGLMALEQGVS